MRCKQCDYPLWNLRPAALPPPPGESPQRCCPECGRPFVPSEFDFVINSVRFCCPHCEQDYYGTGARGHLVPREFDCVRCGRHIDMDQMVLLPTEGISEAQTVTDTMPWMDKRPGHGARSRPLRAFFATLFRAMFEPARLAKSMPAEPQAVRALVFAVISTTVPMVLSMGLLVFFMMMMPFGMGGLGMIGALAGTVLGWLVVLAVLLLLWIVSAHAVLRLTGPVAGDISRTLEPLCYSTAANVIGAVPCVGFYFAWVGWIWAGVTSTIMLGRRQSVSGLRAAAAVFTFPVILLFVVPVAYLILVVPAFTRMQAGAQQGVQQARGIATTSQVRDGVFFYVARNAAWPTHAIELVASNDVPATALVIRGDGAERSPASVAAGPVSLEAFTLLPPERERALTQALIDSLPPDTVAHRLGDFVFTWHGMPPPDQAAGQLWVAVLAAEADTVPGLWRTPIGVVKADGSTGTFFIADLPRELAAQNRHRAAAGLPPLPDPTTIAPGKPATAEGNGGAAGGMR
jgi:hypothetical protein